jgi:sporulation protein YlmC with PRC-barrel domain
MAKQQVNLELLIGKRVRARNGKSIGHLEEIRAELSKGECFVEEYLVGAYAAFERLASLSIGRPILRLLGATRKHRGYRVPWNKLDLTEPERPRLLCEVEELKTLEGEERSEY